MNNKFCAFFANIVSDEETLDPTQYYKPAVSMKNDAVHNLVFTYHHLICHRPHGVAVTDYSIVEMLRVTMVVSC